MPSALVSMGRYQACNHNWFFCHLLLVVPVAYRLHQNQLSHSHLLIDQQLSHCRVTCFTMSCAGPLARDLSGTTVGTTGHLAKQLDHYSIEGINWFIWPMNLPHLQTFRSICQAKLLSWVLNHQQELASRPSIIVTNFLRGAEGIWLYTAYNAYLSGCHAVYPNMNIELIIRLPVVPIPCLLLLQLSLSCIYCSSSSCLAPMSVDPLLVVLLPSHMHQYDLSRTYGCSNKSCPCPFCMCESQLSHSHVC
jgi:hypothetical protein